MQTLLFSILLLAVGMALLGIKLLVKSDGSFVSPHIHDSKAMRERGIDCVVEQDRQARQKGKAC
ncbi:MAG: hypothetical protein IJ196_00590 [Prevotella sp.]|nr:hypothetical protein [Prevotella sp.]